MAAGFPKTGFRKLNKSGMTGFKKQIYLNSKLHLIHNEIGQNVANKSNLTFLAVFLTGHY